jgi:hypothetical protein
LFLSTYLDGDMEGLKAQYPICEYQLYFTELTGIYTDGDKFFKALLCAMQKYPIHFLKLLQVVFFKTAMNGIGDKFGYLEFFARK